MEKEVQWQHLAYLWKPKALASLGVKSMSIPETAALGAATG